MQAHQKSYLFRILRSMAGGVIFGFGTTIVMRCGLGYSAWDVLHEGITLRTGISIGNVSIIVSFVLIAIDFLIKEDVGFGTVLSMVFCGKSIDLFRFLIPDFTFRHYLLAYLPMIGGMFICAYGSYYYMSAGLGTGARDGIMVAMRRHLKMPVGAARFSLEAAAAVSGWLLGGSFGPATIIMAATLGLAVQTVFRLMRYETNKAEHDNVFDSVKKARDYIRNRKKETASPVE